LMKKMKFDWGEHVNQDLLFITEFSITRWVFKDQGSRPICPGHAFR
jgi:hypothetical protein